MELDVYQFISRKDVESRKIGKFRTSLKDRLDIKFEIEFGIADRPFELNFLEFKARNQDTGPFQYMDSELDRYMDESWPKCIKGTAQVSIPIGLEIDNALLIKILFCSRAACWRLTDFDAPLKDLNDQFAKKISYRREYCNYQNFDATGNRRPGGGENYSLTSEGEFLGPGVCSLRNSRDHALYNELAWSQIVPIENPTSVENDLDRIRAKASEMKKHFNSYNELIDAERHLDNGEIKASIRAAASAVDAFLRYYCEIWEVKFSERRLRFDEKIESVLKMAGKKSYREFNSGELVNILYLYRARNAMHDGECEYFDLDDKKIRILKVEQVSELISSAKHFKLWIHSLEW